MKEREEHGIIGDNANIDERAAAAALSKDEADKFIGEFKPYLISMAKKLGKDSQPGGFDDNFSNAMLAFYEAIRCYDAEKGHFLPFATMVIKRRFSDRMKSAYRYDRNIAYENLGGYSADDDEKQGESPLLIRAALDTYERDEKQKNLALEIEQFTYELEKWKITFQDLVEGAPKHSVLREEYKKFASKILSDNEVVSTIMHKKYYPVKKISEILQIPLKKVERTRTYIISIVLIKNGDYEILSEYLNL